MKAKIKNLIMPTLHTHAYVRIELKIVKQELWIIKLIETAFFAVGLIVTTTF